MNLPIRKKADVLIVGGGLGGISAAITSARSGAETILIERNGYPGGTATAGMCCSVFNCMYDCNHKLVVKGIPLQIVNRLAATTNNETKWHNHKGHIIFDIELAKIAFSDMLEEADVMCLYDTIATDVINDGNKITGVIINSKSGNEIILADVIVDATGDADIAALSGTPIHSVNKNFGSANSYCFRLGNVDVDRFVKYFIDNPEQYPSYMDVDWDLEEAVLQYKDTGTFLFPHGGGKQLDYVKNAKISGEFKTTLGVHNTLDAIQMHLIRENGTAHIITGFVQMRDMDINKLSRTMTDGRKMALYINDFFKKQIPGFERSYLSATADDVGIRASRWIDGDFVFTKKDKETAAKFYDSIGHAVTQIDCIKNKNESAWGVQTFSDDYFDIPYRCLIPKITDGLIMGAGRSVSAENPWLLRVMVHTMIIGQGAGTAAAVSVKEKTKPRDIDIGILQSELKKHGIDFQKYS